MNLINLFNILSLLISFTILVLIIIILVRAKSRSESSPPEGYVSVFPYNEARFIHSKEPQYGIPQCKYSGYTPILTCSYDSKV